MSTTGGETGRPLSSYAPGPRCLLGLLGTTALAEARIQAFETEIEQPLQPGQGRRADLQLRYPDNDLLEPIRARQGTNTGYLMARLQRVDPDIASKIGRGLLANS